jgi:multidrug efflux system membrane fusion protein
MEFGPGEPRRRRPSYLQLSAKRPWIAFLVILLLIGLVWGAWALTHQSSGGAGGRGGFGRRGGRPPTTVGVAYAATTDVPVTLDALGTVTPIASVTVRPQVSGVITQVLFKEGQMVKRGQTLAVIDPRPLQMALMQAQGQLTRDEAQLANARLTLTRYRTLLAQDSIARQDVDTQAATVKQLEGAVLTDRANVGTARLNLGYTRVTAPVSGRVGLRAVDVGNVISAGDQNGFVVLTEIAPIDVEFTVPQDQAPQIMQRSMHDKLPVVALDRTRTNQLGRGVFSTLDNQVDPTTGTVRAKARFPNTEGTLFPNQFVNVRVTLDTLKGAVTVPLTAVRTGPNGDFVWVIQADQTVKMQPVKRGQATSTQAVILSGLSPCERVVTEGGDRLTEGGRVILPGQNPFAGRNGRGGRGGRGGGRGGQGAGGPQGGSGGGQHAAAAGGAASQHAAMPAPPPGCPAAGAGGQPGASGFAFSPEMMAAREAMRQACAADFQKLCAGMSGRDAFMCIRQNQAKASQSCQAAIAKMPRPSSPPQGAAVPTPTGPPAAAAPAAQSGAAPAAAPAQGGGGFTPSPEMMAARQAMMSACGADLQKLCPGQEGRERFMCLRQNQAKASAACQAALSKMPRRGSGGGAPAGGR